MLVPRDDAGAEGDRLPKPCHCRRRRCKFPHPRGISSAACSRIGAALYTPPLSLCGDNGAMIGSQGYYEFLAGTRAGQDLNAFATRSIEQPYE